MLGGLYRFILVKKVRGGLNAMDLNTIWFLLIGILLAGYAILDGFDLGVGVLHLFARSERERRTYLNAIGPVWDGKEVWLLTAGGAMVAAFPVVSATLFGGLRLAFMLVLLVLIVRAVSLGFRNQVDHAVWRTVWDWAFGLSSLGASVLFGVAVGNVLQGLPIAADGGLEIPFLALLSPYALLIGALTLALFVLHGAVYMALKTDDDIRERMVRWISRSWRATVLLYFVATVTTYIVSRHLFNGIVTNPLFWIALPLLVGTIGYTAFATHSRNHGRAFVASALTIALMIGMMGIGLYPQMVPSSMDPAYSLTIYNASSTPRTLTAMSVIAVIGVPAVLAYAAWIYRTFASKVVLADDGY